MKKMMYFIKFNSNFNYTILVKMVYFVIFINVITNAYGKKPKFNIAETEFKNGYNYIPKSALG